MRTMLAQRVGYLLVLAPPVLVLGCASTAVVTTWKPPAAYVGATGRVAVCTFGAPGELAQLARSTMIERLRESGTYEIVDAPQWIELPPASDGDTGDEPDLQAAIRWAQSVGADTVLVGHVRVVEEKSYDLGGKVVSIGDLEVKVEVTLRMIDVRRRDQRYQDTCERAYLGTFDPGQRSSRSKPKVIASLVQQCAEQAVGKICASQEDRHVKLAADFMGEGSDAVRRGIKLARKGDWSGARDEWQTALAENPKNDAAMYNMGVALEAAHDFARAHQHYAAAYELSEDDACRQAMVRVQSHYRDLQNAMRAGPHSYAGRTVSHLLAPSATGGHISNAGGPSQLSSGIRRLPPL